MADTYTPYYNLTKPSIGGDPDTWGQLLNDNFDTIDTQMKANADAAAAASAAAAAARTYTDTVFPVGCIIMWNSSRAPIPSNFQLCDGTNGTPDLRDRFIVGAGASYANGSTGGAATVQLTYAQMPAHNHAVSDPGHVHGVYDPGHNHYVNDPGHSHGVDTAVGNGYIGLINLNGGTHGVQNSQVSGTGIWLSASATGISIYGSGTGISTQNAGDNQAHENRPPYYALCFIQRMS
ncbi:MAG: hypothetical protein QJR04_25265 [Burkholderia multivorans]|nr:hypothetical protein [Burkholderia multivorans]